MASSFLEIEGIFRIHQLFGIVVILSHPKVSMKRNRSSICMEIKINGWIFIHFISPPIFIPRLFTFGQELDIPSRSYPSFSTPKIVAKSRWFVRRRVELDQPRHYWLTPPPSCLFNAPCEIQFLRVQSIQPIRHFVLFRYKTVHEIFLSLFSPPPHTPTRLLVSRSSPFRTLFQLSGIRERNYQNSDFYPIFHLENSIVSCFVRMVHARS